MIGVVAYSDKRIGALLDTVPKDYPIMVITHSDKATKVVEPYLTSHNIVSHAFYTNNRGLARSWNDILQVGLYNLGYEYVFLVNDDITFSSGDLETIVQNMSKYMVNTCSGFNTSLNSHVESHGFSAVLLPRYVVDEVGFFDVKFEGAYWEDVDYGIRLHHLGIKTHLIPTNVTHYGSATIKESDITKAHHRNFDKNRKYYYEKWGHTDPAQAFRFPFNNESIPLKLEYNQTI